MKELKQDKADKNQAQRMLITPDLARAWLELRSKNRAISPIQTKRYVNDMRRNRWRLSGETIKFDNSGRLIDGQHRLTACIEANVTFESWVVWGLDSCAMEVIDSGKKRTPGDMLQIRGVSNPKQAAATCRWLLSIKQGLSTTKTRTAFASNDEIISMLERCPDLNDSISKATGSKGMPPSLLAAVHYIGAYKIDKAFEADAFALTFTDGISNTTLYPDPAGDPARAWREKLMALRMKSTSQAINQSVYATTVSIWNRYQSHDELRRSIVTPTRTPEFEGLDVEDL
jgi:hypothetical protein